MNNKPIQVAVVEDSAEYLEAVEMGLEVEPDIELHSKFGTSEAAIHALHLSPLEEQPAVILLDIRLPGKSGLEAIAELRQVAPESKIIVLTQSNREVDVLKAISAGAAGYMLKALSLNKLTEGIRTVAHGGATLDAEVAQFVMKKLKNYLPKSSSDPILSAREMEVLSLLAEGLVKKEIAKKLNIGYTTVDTHVGRIYLKLGVRNAPSAVNRAYKLDLFKPEEPEPLSP